MVGFESLGWWDIIWTCSLPWIGRDVAKNLHLSISQELSCHITPHWASVQALPTTWVNPSHNETYYKKKIINTIFGYDAVQWVRFYLLSIDELAVLLTIIMSRRFHCTFAKIIFNFNCRPGRKMMSDTVTLLKCFRKMVHIVITLGGKRTA